MQKREHLPLKNVPFAKLIKMKTWQMVHFSVANVPFYCIFGCNFINIALFPMFYTDMYLSIHNCHGMTRIC